MKKKIIIVVSILVLLVIGISAGTLFYISKISFDPEETLQEYVGLLNNKDYEGMYSKLTDKSKKNISKEDFITRNKNIYEGIEAKDIKIKTIEIKKNKGVANVKYNISMVTVAGELNFENNIVIKKDEGVDWSSEFIFPNLTDEDKVRVETTAAKRGSILDRNGQALAEDGINANVGFVPGKMGENKDEGIKKVSDILEVSIERINELLSASWVSDDTFVPIKEISANDERIQQLLQVPGILINDKKARVYPLGEKAAHLTGYVQNVTAEDLENNKDKGYTSNSVIGKAGLESIYEDTLRGTNGAEIYIVDKNGDKKEEILLLNVKDGEDVKLTIDINTQIALYDEIKDDNGASVAMNPSTGEVLALVSTPSYDPNNFVMGMSTSKWDSLNNDENKPFFNRFQNTVVPGSVFKPIIAAIGLDNKTIDVNENKDISGLKWQKDSSWGDYYVTRVSDYGSDTNLMNALIYSDNIYFAQAALDIGKDNLAKGLMSLGFDEDIPFEFPLYSSTFGNDSKIDTEIQLADTGYGQGKVLVNPIHLASMYTAFLNDGTMMTPYLNVASNSKAWKENVFSKESASTVLQDMIQIVDNENGTGHEAIIEGLTIAGKTGTAEIKASQDDTNGTEVGWFLGMTTNKGDKNVLIVTMVENVKDKGGSHYVVPKVKNVLEIYK